MLKLAHLTLTVRTLSVGKDLRFLQCCPKSINDKVVYQYLLITLNSLFEKTHYVFGSTHIHL